MPSAQSATSHARYLAPYHFFAQPVLAVWAFWKLWEAGRNPSWATAGDAVVALAVAMLALNARTMALTVQDRLIRLEETLRFQRLIPTLTADDLARITRRQFVALRFAPDEEVPELVRRTLAGELVAPAQIKGAIRNWRADFLRA